jgi:hypothetical protein
MVSVIVRPSGAAITDGGRRRERLVAGVTERMHGQAVLDAYPARLDRSIGLRALFDFFEKTQRVRCDVVA